MSDSQRLNPDIKEIEYGKKELNKLILYPLSLGDQFKVTDMITDIAKELVLAQKEGVSSDYAFVTATMKKIEENIGKVLSLIADIPIEQSEEIVNKLTNSQLMDIVDIVWSVNFEPALKKGKSLFERGKSVFTSKKSLPSSSNAILNTDSKMFTEDPIIKEE